MNRRRLQRRLYRAMLHLHPAPFRDRFGGEMLWIFDETADQVGTPRLLLDALLSLCKQRFADDPLPPFACGPFQTLPSGSFSIARLTQATILAFSAVLGFFALLQQSVPLPRQPRTFAVRRAVFDLCGDNTLEHHAPVPDNHTR